MKFRLAHVIAILLAVLALFSCKKEVGSEVVSLDQIMIYPQTLEAYEDGGDVKVSFMSGKGPLATDLVVIKPRQGEETVLPIKSMSDMSFVFSVPAGLKTGTYSFSLRRDSQAREFKTVVLNIKMIAPASGPYVYGAVTCEGSPMEGVVVSDGFACTKTDNNGRYSILCPYPERSRFAFASIPDGYEPDMTTGFPVFYAKLPAYKTDTPREANIELKKSSGQSEYKVIISADIQIRPAGSAWAEGMAFLTYDVAADYIAELKDIKDRAGCPCYGIALGDMVFNHPASYAKYKEWVPTLGFPYYSVIGNHDHQTSSRSSDDESVVEFEDTFGPRNCSFNIGGVHYILLDNILFIKGSGIDVGIEDAFFEWLKQDLSYVDKSTPIMLCKHHPFTSSSSISTSYQHSKDMFDLLKKYDKVYYWAGDYHYNVPCIFTYDEKLIDAHTITRSPGFQPPNDWVSPDGSPRGVLVVTVKNKEVSWVFEPITRQSGKSQASSDPEYKWRDWNYVNGVAQMKDGSGKLNSDYQIHTYPRGAYDDDFVYANIFNWDAKWGIPTITYGEKTFQMTKTASYDLGYKETNVHYKKVNGQFASSDFPYVMYCHHMFRYRVPEGCSGEATVSVKDRFGKAFTRKVSIDPIKYPENSVHLNFDIDQPGHGWPTVTKSTNGKGNYTINGVQYTLRLTRGYYNTSNNYLVIQGDGNTLSIPAVDGYRLTKVSVRYGENSNKCAAHISSDEAGKTTVAGGESRDFLGGCTDSWDLTGTKAGTEYYLTGHADGFPISELRLIYVK